jgi:GTP cyclohydrolase II
MTSPTIAHASAVSTELVERAVSELRRGSAVVVLAGSGTSHALLVRAAETVDLWPPPYFDQSNIGITSLAVTGRRAAVLKLGNPSSPAVQLNFDQLITPESLRLLISPNLGELSVPLSVRAVKSDRTVQASVLLAKIARLLPAVIIAPIIADDPRKWATEKNRLSIATESIESYSAQSADELQAISDAHVPLAGCEDTRITSFRPRDGGAEHLAIVVGSPDKNKSTLTRLHSECFTGDLLGSLRCDCGDQLRGAVQAIATEGCGILLYLAQEGRGVGLVNKLRAYTLQDQGFDTLEANEQLGFDDDERLYLPAVQMLRALDVSRVRLLTNNPAKVSALIRNGIEVTERVPHTFPSNIHNEKYLQAKAARSGHEL